MTNKALVAANLLERIARLAKTEEQTGGLYPAQWAVLRYLSRANKFSRTPMALTKYLATTRGTMSQTIIALERKGYVERCASETDKRSVNVELTNAGRNTLRNDPIINLATELNTALGAHTERFSDHLLAVMAQLVKVQGGQMFGMCGACRHFESGGGTTARRPHRCSLLDVALSEPDSELICVEQESA